LDGPHALRALAALAALAAAGTAKVARQTAATDKNCSALMRWAINFCNICIPYCPFCRLLARIAAWHVIKIPENDQTVMHRHCGRVENASVAVCLLMITRRWSQDARRVGDQDAACAGLAAAGTPYAPDVLSAAGDRYCTHD